MIRMEGKRGQDDNQNINFNQMSSSNIKNKKNIIENNLNSNEKYLSSVQKESKRGWDLIDHKNENKSNRNFDDNNNNHNNNDSN